MKTFKALMTLIGFTILQTATGSNVDIFPATPARGNLCHCSPGTNCSPCSTPFVWDARVNECVLSGHRCAYTVNMGGGGLSSTGRVKREANGVTVLCGTKECQADVYLYDVCNRSAQHMVVTNARIEVTSLESLTLRNGMKSFDIVPESSTNTTSMILPAFPAEYEMTFVYKSLDSNMTFELDMDVCCWPRDFVCGQHCTSCNVAGPGKCDIEACDNGYYLNGSTEECNPICGKHCALCIMAGPGKCDIDACDSGYYFNGDIEECRPRCGKHCATCDHAGPGKCDIDSCHSGYFFIPGTEECQPNYPTRLYNRNTYESMKGRLEIYYYGKWGTVCDDGFDDVAASVACYSINPRYHKGEVIGQNSVNYGPGYDRIWLDDVVCKSDHINIGHCTHLEWGQHNCEHGEDVAIKCHYTGCRRDPCPNGATCREVTSARNDYICECDDGYYKPQCRTGTLKKITS